MNCGICGRPVYTGGPICDGCKKSKNIRGKKEQKKLDWQEEKEKVREEDEDAQDVWVDD